MSWRSSFNLTENPLGTSRSITGYGAESLIIGRALLCGYNLFFKAWRDSKYDAVLEANKILFRVEFKGTSTKDLSLTSGARSGKQIKRTAGSREKVLSTDDSEILIGIDSACGICWIIPTEIIKIIGKKKLPIKYLNQFKERWGLMHLLSSSPEMCRKILTFGMLGVSQEEQQMIISCFGEGRVPGDSVNPFDIGSYKFDGESKRALNLWKMIYDQAG